MRRDQDFNVGGNETFERKTLAFWVHLPSPFTTKKFVLLPLIYLGRRSETHIGPKSQHRRKIDINLPTVLRVPIL